MTYPPGYSIALGRCVHTHRRRPFFSISVCLARGGSLEKCGSKMGEIACSWIRERAQVPA